MLICLRRTVARRANPQVVRKHLLKALENAVKFDRRFSVGKLTVAVTETGHVAEVDVRLGTAPDHILEGFRNHLRAVLVSRFDPPWFIVDKADLPADPPASGEDGKVPPLEKVIERPFGKVNLDFPPAAFERIYGRDAQLRRIVDAISLGRDTNWIKRKHSLLSGPPGCGKTEIMLTLSRHVGKEGEAYLWYDATSATKAGVIEQLMTAPVIPPLLFIEEIEKVPDGALRFLLGIMDDRGELRRTNYRVGNQVKSVRSTVIATANDINLLRQVDSGSIYSRFGNRIDCPIPDRATVEKILHREVVEMDGDGRWVTKTLEFAYDHLGVRDTRELLNVLLCGRARLLDGTYQKDYEATMPPEDRARLKSEK